MKNIVPGSPKNLSRSGYELPHNARIPEMFAALPSHVQAQARSAYALFRADPTHPGLHFKRVYPDPPLYSARVGIGYRAVGALDGNTIVWFWIGSHADYDRLLATL